MRFNDMVGTFIKVNILEKSLPSCINTSQSSINPLASSHFGNDLPEDRGLNEGRHLVSKMKLK
jgi:hypothetical protein